ncbi:uncharacterized protein LOC124354680 [Homalodisca vitripennis]|uniref:uncharacterized protein LOC124354680 n=1 Tax=Homalodisca vitripennis TaxID=197043 RepID=UPI001EEA0A5C|nr:uncharacterized protein LOC124354680 [Homalodisca vitripennis]
MVRNYTRKTDRGKVPDESFEKAYEAVKTKTMSLREAVVAFEIDKMTLFRFIRKKDESQGQTVTMGYTKRRKIFPDQLESQLEEYIIHSSKIYYGVTPQNIKVLAYELAMANRNIITLPDSWINHKMATKDWFSLFMKRHPRLSIREPEATSLSRATSFNKVNVDLFFDNLKSTLDKYKIEPKDIWNIDETGVQTVQRPNKIVAQKGVRQVGKATSAERGQTVTMVLAVSAIGHSVPPMLVFPRVFFKDHFIINGPPGCIGTSYPSGWITSESFLTFIKHFHGHVRSSKGNPCLLVLDNHESHLSIEVLNFCKENGIVMLSFPPHTSHRLQPLDRSVYGPFKRFYFASVDDWMVNNAGKTVTIYDIPGIVKMALPRAINPTNIISGFQATGIAPYNREVFTENDFLFSAVTDREMTSQDSTVKTSQAGTSNADGLHSKVNRTETTTAIPSTNKDVSVGVFTVSPQEIRPYPKARERKNIKKGRKSLKFAILTSTPVKERLEVEAKKRKLKW